MPGHIALLGDSVFDNGSYTSGEPDVAEHLRATVPSSWEVTLCAVDGASTTDLGPQLDRVPDAATHVVLSVGGNDAIDNADLLQTEVESTGAALELFRERLQPFESSYCRALDGLLRLDRKTIVCTIYNGNLEGAEATRAPVALMMFNDIIARSALVQSVDLIELRLVCTDASHFANPIEPSSSGGLEIARAIAMAVGLGAERGPQSTVVCGRRPP